eukprot:TRINITY_DN695_c0_g1_i1.p1 TRINITY_DN695_c0_g1~~TRINITY_DN695_c0_g1_i1.p1  ORF type:complete len:116 (+),score=12.24 TRINITY_DN695_c0_g1_i1:89-436(+)
MCIRDRVSTQSTGVGESEHIRHGSATDLHRMSQQQVVALYRKCLRLAQSFTDYNIRNYAVRVVRDDFRKLGDSSSTKEQDSAYSKGLKASEMLQRQVAVYSMYAPKDRPHVAEQR